MKGIASSSHAGPSFSTDTYVSSSTHNKTQLYTDIANHNDGTVLSEIGKLDFE